jgi:hypothetical protein
MHGFFIGVPQKQVQLRPAKTVAGIDSQGSKRVENV